MFLLLKPDEVRGANSNLVYRLSFRIVYEYSAQADQDRSRVREERGNNTRKRSALAFASMAEGFTMVMGRDKNEITGGRLEKKARA